MSHPNVAYFLGCNDPRHAVPMFYSSAIHIFSDEAVMLEVPLAQWDLPDGTPCTAVLIGYRRSKVDAFFVDAYHGHASHIDIIRVMCHRRIIATLSARNTLPLSPLLELHHSGRVTLCPWPSPGTDLLGLLKGFPL